ncbi:hypothetical protein HNQ60_003004 [Povalibacter uvarum]|uniref:Uncharacterized protein n=1 Tax=Povalibacter uvarum TaxID=732238 RepID=A0A841HN05_9GAMM|nr:hypothetical protein [Povalibacter uvarum]MBB6094123.1 hypothetical protein [Povalibacter uvarum]
MYSVLIDDCRKLLTPSETGHTIAASAIDIEVSRDTTLAAWMQRRRESSARTTDGMIIDGPFAETKG